MVGGVSKPVTEEERRRIVELAKRSIETARFSLKLFEDIVLANKPYVDLIPSDMSSHQTCYMGLVDESNKVNFYDGKVRIVGPDGHELVEYSPESYLDVVAEHIEPWTYLKFPYLKQVGWRGFVEGPDSGVYPATPLSRPNASNGMARPLA